jgi:RNase H-fold protein (predicted Holliday junction resolvase)
MIMDYILPDELRVLAIDPSTRGLGFAVLEGPHRLLDWGVKQATDDKNAESVRIVKELIEQYRPHVLVLENVQGNNSRRRSRVRELLQLIREAARRQGVKVMDETPDRVRTAFTPKKDTIAAALAGRFPELASRLPKPRTLTMPEHSAMPVFDATAFAMTFFHFRNRKRLVEERKVIRSALG